MIENGGHGRAARATLAAVADVAVKIAEGHTHLPDLPLGTAFESASVRFELRQDVLVEIVCDDGTTGWDLPGRHQIMQ